MALDIPGSCEIRESRLGDGSSGTLCEDRLTNHSKGPEFAPNTHVHSAMLPHVQHLHVSFPGSLSERCTGSLMNARSRLKQYVGR